MVKEVVRTIFFSYIHTQTATEFYFDLSEKRILLFTLPLSVQDKCKNI